VAAGGAVPAFNVANASATVTVTLANHGQTTSPPSAFNLPLQTVLGSSGITLAAQSYLVNSVIDTGHFTITAATVASASATASLNGGDAQIQYLLSTGNASNLPGGGYGVGEYGEGNYGAANTVSGTVTMRVWSLDNYGQDLIASPNGGTIYYWQPGQTGPAVVVPSTPPTQCNWIFSIPEVQMVMALGVSSGGTQYPLLAAWCDTGGLFETNGWAPTATNQAGSFQLNSGSMLVFGAANGLTLYLWTDFGVWSVTYQGLPYVWSFNEMARECGAISSRAVAISAIGAAWLSSQGFFQLTGNGVQPMECPVWDFYVNNVDTSQLQAITSCLNTQFHEVSWQFPVIGGGYAEVKWNWLENVWDYTPAGLKPRTAWIDASPAGNPMGVDAAGLVQQHEIGYNANGQPLTPYAQTGFFDVADGDDYVFVDQIIPDFVRENSAAVTLSVLRQSYPEAPTSIDGPYSITANNFITCNSRGRQLAIGMGSSDSNSFWRLGALRYRFRPDGKI
jgi:hypothetical protein